jgi:hypothetical protein
MQRRWYLFSSEIGLPPLEVIPAKRASDIRQTGAIADQERIVAADRTHGKEVFSLSRTVSDCIAPRAWAVTLRHGSTNGPKSTPGGRRV